jgi:hypothetical protein
VYGLKNMRFEAEIVWKRPGDAGKVFRQDITEKRKAPCAAFPDTGRITGTIADRHRLTMRRVV